MAEINARREARRRRILENSESRLRRITGRVNPGEIEDNEPRVESDSLKAESNFEEDNIRNGVYNINSDTKLQDCARFDDRHESFLNDTSDKNTHSPEQESKSKFMLSTLLLNRVTFILLAGIVNILLVLKLDNLFGQAVIIPCLLLIVGRLYRRMTLHEAQEHGNLLAAALVLCNVKPRLIYIFKVSYTLFTVVLNDFGLYMFSFVLMRYTIIRYYYNAAIPINA
ncbi:PREDICTED: uncharacterized protein LOC105460443 [Wasmannia auropunctata]|uniref:uncharacterized protein LOC105460443 n=1 Tax=Wasmannia auropunctata TaxID=64793 RepID=UPI0005EFE32F|nr:PREDICTED: uncharacterized protein LOC105460443 [Wasmannia auropunctata]